MLGMTMMVAVMKEWPVISIKIVKRFWFKMHSEESNLLQDLHRTEVTMLISIFNSWSIHPTA